MRLAYALLADAAQVTPDGKLSMLGADFDTIFARMFPITHPSLMLVIGLEVERQEVGLEHRLRVTSSGPLNTQFLAPIENNFTPQSAPGFDNRPPKVRSVLSFQGLQFPTQGKYEFQVSVDGRRLGAVPLYLAPLH